MTLQEKISIVMQIITLIGIIFAVYLYFRKPQEKGEVTDAVFTEKFTSLDRELANLRDNHIHTLGTELRDHISESQTVALRGAEKMGSMEAKIDILLAKLK